MRPPITTIPGITALWGAIGKSGRAANDPGTVATVTEDECGSVLEFKPTPPTPPARRP